MDNDGVPGPKQHYLPACLIGQFGISAAQGGARESEVAVLERSAGATVRSARAKEIAWEKGMYRLTSPPPEVNPDVIDELWGDVESKIPGLVKRLEHHRMQADDQIALLDYAAMVAVRHPSFRAWLNAFCVVKELPRMVEDDVQWARVVALTSQRKAVETWRWRVLHSPPDGKRLMVTDMGCVIVTSGRYAFGEQVDGIQRKGMLLPMSPRVAILGYLDDPKLPPPRPAFEEHRDLCDGWIEQVNAFAWSDQNITTLIAHPDDKGRLARVPEKLAGQGQQLPGDYGPYRVPHARALGWFN